MHHGPVSYGMRFPSLDLLAARALAVLRRFPLTILVAAVAAVAAAIAVDARDDDLWRLAFSAALGLPATIGLALVGEVRGWPAAKKLGAQALALAGIAAFFVFWPGLDRKHDAIRYFQLSAALHLAVAFLPFLGAAESRAFWQYNRRMFLGFLRSVVFSAVLFIGIAIALGALDKLFGADIDSETYFRIWIIIALLANTWIFLATVPEEILELATDTEYPRALKVFTQYILTPLAFTYLLLLLAYLVKIVAGAEWPSGWIGWLVASVAVTGLFGFLLVHPLRADPEEGWIRIYARWLFVGLIPAAVMLLVAFAKRIVPYGLTEPRVLGVVLGVWLLGIALLFTLRPGASIRTIPVSLSAILLLTLYGPVSLTSVSLRSQAGRLSERIAGAAANRDDAREASAALRFLLDHEAEGAIESAIGQEIPAVNWDSLPRYGEGRDSLGSRIMQLAGASYHPEYMTYDGNEGFYLNSDRSRGMPIAGYDWMTPVSSAVSMRRDSAARMVPVPIPSGSDSITVDFDSSGIARIAVSADTLVFDLGALARTMADSVPRNRQIAADRMRLEATAGSTRARLEVESIGGTRNGDSVRVNHWNGWLLVGR